ncbi:hypothetical protein B0J14DRAFT_647877 [Halenospora varia]|nr:hypothetical protein B0J14DRAFT_647877 [Halenospora varia]
MFKRLKEMLLRKARSNRVPGHEEQVPTENSPSQPSTSDNTLIVSPSSNESQNQSHDSPDQITSTSSPSDAIAQLQLEVQRLTLEWQTACDRGQPSSNSTVNFTAMPNDVAPSPAVNGGTTSSSDTDEGEVGSITRGQTGGRLLHLQPHRMVQELLGRARAAFFSRAATAETRGSSRFTAPETDEPANSGATSGAVPQEALATEDIPQVEPRTVAGLALQMLQENPSIFDRGEGNSHVRPNSPRQVESPVRGLEDPFRLALDEQDQLRQNSTSTSVSDPPNQTTSNSSSENLAQPLVQHGVPTTIPSDSTSEIVLQGRTRSRNRGAGNNHTPIDYANDGTLYINLNQVVENRLTELGVPSDERIRRLMFLVNRPTEPEDGEEEAAGAFSALIEAIAWSAPGHEEPVRTRAPDRTTSQAIVEANSIPPGWPLPIAARATMVPGLATTGSMPSQTGSGATMRIPTDVPTRHGSRAGDLWPSVVPPLSPVTIVGGFQRDLEDINPLFGNRPSTPESYREALVSVFPSRTPSRATVALSNTASWVYSQINFEGSDETSDKPRGDNGPGQTIWPPQARIYDSRASTPDVERSAISKDLVESSEQYNFNSERRRVLRERMMNDMARHDEMREDALQRENGYRRHRRQTESPVILQSPSSYLDEPRWRFPVIAIDTEVGRLWTTLRNDGYRYPNDVSDDDRRVYGDLLDTLRLTIIRNMMRTAVEDGLDIREWTSYSVDLGPQNRPNGFVSLEIAQFWVALRHGWGAWIPTNRFLQSIRELLLEHAEILTASRAEEIEFSDNSDAIVTLLSRIDQSGISEEEKVVFTVTLPASDPVPIASMFETWLTLRGQADTTRRPTEEQLSSDELRRDRLERLFVENWLINGRSFSGDPTESAVSDGSSRGSSRSLVDD